MNAAEIQQKIVGFLVSATGQSSIDGDTELGIRLEFEDITPDVFETPAAISRLIENRIAGQHH